MLHLQRIFEFCKVYEGTSGLFDDLYAFVDAVDARFHSTVASCCLILRIYRADVFAKPPVLAALITGVHAWKTVLHPSHYAHTRNRYSTFCV